MKSFLIPEYWTAEQALAVYDFIDTIRDEIWSRYELQLIDIIKAEHSADRDNWESYENYEGGPDEDIDF